MFAQGVSAVIPIGDFLRQPVFDGRLSLCDPLLLTRLHFAEVLGDDLCMRGHRIDLDDRLSQEHVGAPSCWFSG
jgi:hypothetical protein